MSMFVRPAKNYTCFDIDGAVKLRISESNSPAPITIPHFFRESCKKYRSQPALRYEEKPKVGDPKWITVSFAELKEKAEQVALMLLSSGLQAHDVVGIIASNSPEWLYAQFGTLCAGGIVFGAHVTSSEEVIEHMLKTSSATVCVVENTEQMLKVRAARKNLPKLRVIIQINRCSEESLCEEDGYYFWKDVISRNYENFKQELQERKQKIYANECAMLLYTSGTTGMPKAVMVSHDNLITCIRVTRQMFPHLTRSANGTIVSYLPLCHIVGQMYEICTAIQFGACIYFAEPNAIKGTLVKTLQIARPTLFIGVPRVYEKLKEHIGKIKDFGARKSIGMDRCKVMLCGAAPLSAELKDFFNDLGMFIINLYGLSETTGGVSCNFDPLKQGIGKVTAETEVKIEPCGLEQEGELCFRGRSIFMGYLNEPKKTFESIDAKGWFHTGDAGYLDSDGNLYITSRIKELVITSGGENIPPVRIEEMIKKELPVISNAMVVGDQRKYLTVLLTIKTKIDQCTGRPLDDLSQEAIEWFCSLGFEYQKLSEVLNVSADNDLKNYSPKVDQKILASIDAGIKRANTFALLRSQRIQKFALLPHDFSLPTEEIGPTLKLRREYVMKKYAAIIDELYK